MRQVGIIAAAGIYALDHHMERLKEDHQNAKRLALGLKKLKGFSIDPEEVETNIIIFNIAFFFGLSMNNVGPFVVVCCFLNCGYDCFCRGAFHGGDSENFKPYQKSSNPGLKSGLFIG